MEKKNSKRASSTSYKSSYTTADSVRLKRQRIQRREKKLCTYCGKPVDRDGILCTSCLNYMHEYSKGRKELLLSLGLCPICGKHEIFGHERSCLECRAKQANSRDIKKYEEDNKARYNKRKEQGLCPRCGKSKPDDGYSWCDECREKTRKNKIRKGKKNVRAEWDSELCCLMCGKPERMEGQKYCEDCYRIKVYAAKKMRENRTDDYKKAWSESNMRMRGRFKRYPKP